ncbi:MAG: DUF885 domain-containing protein [Chloroflexota bacterium]
MAHFAPVVDAFLAEYFELNPTAATAAGQHAYDDRWPDLTATGRARRREFRERWLGRLRALDDLDVDEAVDRDLLVLELESQDFAETELRDDAWDPLWWVYLFGGGLFDLVSRTFAPAPARMTSLAGRLDGMSALVEASEAALVGHAGRPVGRFQTEKALEQLPGVVALADEALAESARAAAGDPDLAALMPGLQSAVESARGAMGRFEAHLRDRVLPGSDGEGRIGPELFATKLHHALRVNGMSPERVLERAEAEFAAVRAEMIRLARELWPTWCPGRPMPTDEGEVVRAVLDAIAVEHPSPEELLDFCRAEVRRIEAFCRERDLIDLPDDPLEITWTPVFLRSSGGAMVIPPGPLDRGEKAFFAITPIPDDWPPERRESYLREENTRMLRLTTIHEAVPGHYLQIVEGNRSSSLPRAVFYSGVYVEGWAVYVTQVMVDLGYGDREGALLLNHWKLYLRSATNAIIDVRIHTAGMTEQEAVGLMVEGGFQEEAEARAKYDRARLSSTQLSTYFVGSAEMWDIELEARRRAAAAVGANVTIEPGPLPGGLGETPGFRYRDHLTRVVRQGSPPTSLLRRLVFGEALGPTAG